MWSRRQRFDALHRSVAERDAHLAREQARLVDERAAHSATVKALAAEVERNRGDHDHAWCEEGWRHALVTAEFVSTAIDARIPRLIRALLAGRKTIAERDRTIAARDASIGGMEKAATWLRAENAALKRDGLAASFVPPPAASDQSAAEIARLNDLLAECLRREQASADAIRKADERAARAVNEAAGAPRGGDTAPKPNPMWRKTSAGAW